MDEFAKMDIFFVVTTIAVVVVGLLLSVVLYKLWRILGHVERFAEELSEETKLVREDIAEFRGHVKSGLRMSRIVKFWRSLGGEIKKKTKG